MSSKPVLTEQECDILIKNEENDEQRYIVSKVMNILDHITNCPSHSGERPPRFIDYEPVLSMKEIDVIPDGLHVDINNGMLFRHITALLYLTGSNDSIDEKNREGATVFPLATWNKDGVKTSPCHQAAKELIESGVFHTHKQQSINSQLLESAARDLLYKNNENICGVRVFPQAGRLCIFYNRLDCGNPDAFSFHGGEACYQEKKALLTFFKEIPRNSFQDFDGFAKKVSEARKWVIKNYY